MKPVRVVIQADDVAGVLSELDVAGGCDAHRLFGVVGHLLGVEIHGASVRPKDLVFESAYPGTPFLAGVVQNAASFFRVQQDGARAPAVLHW